MNMSWSLTFIEISKKKVNVKVWDLKSKCIIIGFDSKLRQFNKKVDV